MRRACLGIFIVTLVIGVCHSQEKSPIPQKYLGKWRGIEGEARLRERRQEGIKFTEIDLGFIINQFEFDVAEDGKITGSGSATYWFNVHGGAGGPAPFNIQAESHLEGGQQMVKFSIVGETTCKESRQNKLSVYALGWMV